MVRHCRKDLRPHDSLSGASERQLRLAAGLAVAIGPLLPLGLQGWVEGADRRRRGGEALDLDTNVLLRPVQLAATGEIGCGHSRIDAGCAITSVGPKSPPLNNSGARMTVETA